MKLVQFWRPNLGYRVGLVRGENVTDITMPEAGLKSTGDFIEHAAAGNLGLAEFVESQLNAAPRAIYAWNELDVSRDVFEPHLALPIIPPEVWAAGLTYAYGSDSREADSRLDSLTADGRPEIFFKATGARCVGPNSAIGVRRDSIFTVPEPELALIVGHRRDIVAFTLANDVTACDIRMESPLYLVQSKVFRGSCALGPALVTPEEMGDPYKVDVRCRIVRNGQIVFEGSCNTAGLQRRFDELLDYLLRDNPVPGGSVLCTGTGIAFPTSAALEDGDLVEIEIPQIGVLRNPVKRWGVHGDA
jgi:2-dehydro-3-deoxy-D-arabinonate dehydratase